MPDENPPADVAAPEAAAPAPDTAAPAPAEAAAPAETALSNAAEGNAEASAQDSATADQSEVTDSVNEAAAPAEQSEIVETPVEHPVDQAVAALETRAAVAALTPATPEEDHPVNNAEAFLKTVDVEVHELVKEAVAHVEALLALIKRII